MRPTSFLLRSPAQFHAQSATPPHRAALGVLAAGASVLLACGARTPAAGAPVNTAGAVIAYHPGADPDARFGDPDAALGGLDGNTGYGGLNPFNPPFGPADDALADIVIIEAGGHLTLRTALPFATSGFNLGVFVNNGIQDVSGNGTGRAGSPPEYFSGTPKARVAFSSDNVTWEYLNDGTVIDFDKPTNVYLDTDLEPDEWNGAYQPVGEVEADMGKPWTGSLSDLSGDTYDQIRAEFDGSAGGNWLNLDGLTLDQARYVRFEAVDSRMVVDAIATDTAVPEPSAGLAILGGAVVVLRRRRRASTAPDGSATSGAR